MAPNPSPASAPERESSFLSALLQRLTTTIRSLKSESLLRLHELLDWEGEAVAPPADPQWHAAVHLVEGELARRGQAVRLIRRYDAVAVGAS